MPPKGRKRDPRARGGGNSVADIEARNTCDRDEETGKLNVEPLKGKGYGKGKGKPQQQESSDEESSAEEEKEKKPAKKGAAEKKEPESGNPNAKPTNVDKDGIGELSRKQREEIEKQAARRRYEELHKAGKTDEAKVDLARLAEVKERRAAAAALKAEAEAAAKAKEDERKGKSGMSREVREALGGEAAGSRRSKTGKDIEEAPKEKRKPGPDLFTDMKVEDVKGETNLRGTGGSKNMQSCREAEDDFM